MYRLFLVGAAFVVLLISQPFAGAQDDAPGVEVDPDIELMRLYDTPGRAWTYREVSWERGFRPSVERQTYEVESVEEGRVTVVHITTDDGGDSSTGSNTFSIDNVKEEDKQRADKKLPVETLDLGFGKFECRKHVVKEEDVHTTTWVSTEFHPLVVKQTTFGAEQYTIRKLTSFHDALKDPWQLYRMKGRSWTWKTTMTKDGETEVTYARSTVTELLENGAVVHVSETNEASEEIDSWDDTHDFSGAWHVAFDSEDKVVSLDCAAGEFECALTEPTPGAQVWLSLTWPSLIVRYKSPDLEVELVEFDLGHDYFRFYRTAGNTYTTSQTMRMPNMTMVTKSRYTVIKVDGDKSTYRIETLDEQGRVQFSQETDMDLPELDPDKPAMRYAGQQEDSIGTPAGRVSAVRVETGDITSWMWNGVMVRMEMKMEGMESVTTLEELNVE